MTWVVGRIPANAEWTYQTAYDSILGSTPRIIGASLVAYLVGELVNSSILLKIREYTGMKHLWMRSLGSSVIGHALDTALFLLVAFVGMYSIDTLSSMFVSNFLWKIGTEVLITPLLYVIISSIRKYEKI